MDKWIKENQKLVIISLLVLGVVIVSGISINKNNTQHRSTSNTSQQTSSNSSSKSPYNDPSQFTDTQFANVIGGYRIEAGVHPLQRDPSLDAAARNHAYDMQIHNYSSSTSPDGVTDAQRIENAISGTTYSGEWWDNLCSNATDSLELSRILDGGQGEQTLTNPQYDYYGVGLVANTNTSGSTCNGYLVVYYASVH